MPSPREAAWYYWALGLAHSFKGQGAEAEASLSEMGKALEKLKESSKSVPPQLEAARVELEGHIAARSGKPEKGLELLRRAARLEDELVHRLLGAGRKGARRKPARGSHS